MAIECDGLDGALWRLYKAIKAIKAEGRAHGGGTRGASRELLGVSLRILKPRARISRSENRGKPFSAIGELQFASASTRFVVFGRRGPKAGRRIPPVVAFRLKHRALEPAPEPNGRMQARYLPMMPQSFEEAFPQLRAVQPFMPLGPALAWQGALDWADEAAIVLFARTVLERMTFAAERELGWLNEIADAATRDLNALLATAPDERATRSILFLRFLFTLPAMEAAFSHGRRGASYDWAFRGLTADYDDRRRRNDGYVYLPLRQLGDPRIGTYATRWLPRWCHSFFLMARDAEVRREVAATFTPCWEEHRLRGPRDRGLREGSWLARGDIPGERRRRCRRLPRLLPAVRARRPVGRRARRVRRPPA